MRRRILLLLMVPLLLPVAGVGASAAPPAHSAKEKVSDGTGPLDTAADLKAALHFEELIPEHTASGMITPWHYDKWPQLDPTAKPLYSDGMPDSGNYTGVYLAAQSWRYAQAKAELKKLGVDPLSTAKGGPEAVRFWKGQRNEARTRAAEMVKYFHILVNIAKYWQTEFDPKVDPDKTPQDDGWFDFGGGLVPGEAGLLMRTCTPADVTEKHKDLRVNYAPTGRLRGPLRWEDGRDWYCLEGTSRDSYAGTIFGLSVALDFLGTPENAALRDSLGADLRAMTDYAVKYLWFQPRPHGTVTNPAFGGNDLEGPISPLFIQVPLHRLHLVQTAKRAAIVMGDTDAALKYDALWKEEVANGVLSGSLLDSMVIDASEQHNAEYKYQLHLMSFFNVIRLESDPVIKEELMRAMGVLDPTLSDDDNAYYEAITLGLTGEKRRLTKAVSLHRQWLDYYAFHLAAAKRGKTPFLHTPRCAITSAPPGAPLEQQPLTCVPKDQVDMITTLPTGEEVETPFSPGTVEALRAKDPLPVGVRRLADFMWQKDPTIIGGDHDKPWRGPSIDFLGTYWMLRYYSEVAPAATEHPLPAWLGPRFS